MQPSKLAVRAVIVIDWLITVGGDGSQQVYARPIGLTCVDRPCGGRIAIAICGPFCPVLPRFGLNNVAPWLHHRPVKGAVSHSVTQVKDKLRSRRLPGPAMGGLIKALRWQIFLRPDAQRSCDARPSIRSPG
jgi:hypothetical protein